MVYKRTQHVVPNMLTQRVAFARTGLNVHLPGGGNLQSETMAGVNSRFAVKTEEEILREFVYVITLFSSIMVHRMFTSMLCMSVNILPATIHLDYRE